MDSEEKYWYSVFSIFLALLVALVIFLLTSAKNVRYYYLANDGGGTLSIGVDIDNCSDDFIDVNGMSIEKVVAIIDSLNNNLKSIKEK